MPFLVVRITFDNVEYCSENAAASRVFAKIAREPAYSEPTEGGRVIQAIDRAARVLAALQGSRHLGITELGALLELPPSTVHGIVKSLQEHGLVSKEPHGQRYMLGPTLLQLSNVYLDTLDVRARAMRWTGDLSERTGLAVRLGVEFFDQVIVIHHEPRPDGSRQMPETGVTIPAHASALGKVLLAYRPEFKRALLATGPLRSLTAETVVEPDALDKSLAEVLEKGYAVEDEEAVLGEASVAVPVADRDSEAVAAIAVVLPASQQPVEDSVLTLLREAARNVSRELGSPTWPPVVAAPDA
jgi:DNA-binding IclR family transcriptional regulator